MTLEQLTARVAALEEAHRNQSTDAEYCESIRKEKEEWPQNGDNYYLFEGSGNVHSDCFYEANTTDIGRREFRNCFRTRAEAEQARDKVKELLLSLKENS